MSPAAPDPEPPAARRAEPSRGGALGPRGRMAGRTPRRPARRSLRGRLAHAGSEAGQTAPGEPPPRDRLSSAFPAPSPETVEADRAGSEAATECALQLRKIGDKWNLRQRILNLISKLFCPGT